MKWLLAALLSLLSFPLVRAQTQSALPVIGFCVNGAKPAITSGLASSNFNQNLIPKCTVSVFLAGTTSPATIYADPSQTPLTNPFTANQDASWQFYVAPSAPGQAYDITLSGGIPPNTYTSPRTLVNWLPVGGGGGGGGGGGPTVPMNLMAFGAVPDERDIYDAGVSGAALTSNTAQFTPLDNKRIFLVPDGAQGVLYATYISGGTPTGTTGQTCTVTGFNGGGSNTSGVIYLNGTNTFAANATIYTSPSYGTGFTSAPTSATLGTGGPNPATSCSGAITITSTMATYPMLTTATYVNATTMALAAPATTNGTNLHVSIGTDNAGAIHNWITACQAAAQSVSCYAPAGQYLTTQTATVTQPIRLQGDGAYAQFGSGSTFSQFYPVTPPFLTGSIFVEAGLGIDAFDIDAQAAAVNIFDIGVRFAPAIAFWDTGHGFNSSPSVTFGGFPVWGVMSFSWERDSVWGQDGNHYAWVITNSEAGRLIGLSSWGGGGLFWTANTNQCCPGNSTVDQFVAGVGVGGAAGTTPTGGAGGIVLYNQPTTSANNNLMWIMRPNIGVYPIASVSPAGNVVLGFNLPPVSPSQPQYYLDDNQRNIYMAATDFEGNSGGGSRFPVRPYDFAIFGESTGFSFIPLQFAITPNSLNGAAYAYNANHHSATVPIMQVGDTGRGIGTNFELGLLQPLAGPTSVQGLGIGQTLARGDSLALLFNYEGDNSPNSWIQLGIYDDPALLISPAGWLGIMTGTPSTTALPTTPFQVGTNAGNPIPANTTAARFYANNSSISTPVVGVETDAVIGAPAVVETFLAPDASPSAGAFPFTCTGVDIATTGDCLIFGMHYVGPGDPGNYGDIHLFNSPGDIVIDSSGHVGINTGNTPLTYTMSVNGPLEFAQLVSGGHPSITGCNLNSAVGTQVAGTFASGTSGTCTVTVTLSIAAPNGWSCGRPSDLTTPADTSSWQQTATTTTTATLAGTTASGDDMIWGPCVAY